MKSLLAAVAVTALTIGISGAAMAHDINIGVSIGVPAPVRVAPPVVVYRPSPPPVVYAPAPVVATSRWHDRREWREHKWREHQRREWREQRRHEREDRHHRDHDYRHWR
jgi:hypothetical protein